jgi:hypothetical protein
VRDQVVLVVTRSDDLTVDLVIRHLVRRGTRFLRLDTDRLGQPALHFGFSDGRPELVTSSGRLRPEDVRSVWARRFASPAVLEAVARPHQSFVRRELSTVLDAFIDSTAGLHVNPLDVDRRAGNRLLQAMAASAVGFAVPDTLATQDVGRARTFMAAHDRVVAKALSFGAVDEERDQVTMTTEINRATSFEGADICPVHLQERVRKQREWRVTTVGTRIFAACSQGDPDELPIDWRAVEKQWNLFKAAELPRHVEKRLLALVQDTSLRFGAHDIVERPDGEFVFLETNPAGQWGWLELSLGLPIGETLADLLVQGPGE